MGTAQSGAHSAALLLGKTRLAILAFLYARKTESFYFREIVRSLGVGSGGAQRAIDQLSATGLIRRTARGRQVFYQAETRHPLFPDLNAIINKTVGIQSTLQIALQPIASRIRIAFIYGSVARHEEGLGSDVDLLIIGNAGFGEVTECLAGAQKAVAREVNPSVFSPLEWKRKLRQGNHFLTAVLGDKKLFVFGDERELSKLGGKRLARTAPANKKSRISSASPTEILGPLPSRNCPTTGA